MFFTYFLITLQDMRTGETITHEVETPLNYFDAWRYATEKATEITKEAFKTNKYITLKSIEDITRR